MGRKIIVKAEGNPIKPKDTKHLINIEEILKCTNATPIGRYHFVGFSCCYCKEKFKQPHELKEHTLVNHRHVTRARFMKKSLREFQVNLDITSLMCELCHSSIDTLEEAIEHLKEAHEKNMATDIKNHIVPFKFDSDVFKCCVCTTEFSNYKPLLMHMHVHYRNYECEICGIGFVSAHNLYSHKQSHQAGEFKCEICSKVFVSDLKRRKHEKSHFDANTHKCPYCVEAFSNNRNRNNHMAKVHGIPLPTYPCKACGKIFTDTTPYRRHMKRDHLLEKPHNCKLCSKSFFSARLLRDHMISHSRVKKFRCEVCDKSYGRKTTLTEHIRIHNNDRRFKCEHCEQAFVQKCSWKSHMRSKHGQDA